MKQRNARYLDDLCNGTNRPAVYKHIRDGHVADIFEIISGLECLLPSETAIEALIALVYLLIETREIRGSDKTRQRDKLVAKLLPKLKIEQQARSR